ADDGAEPSRDGGNSLEPLHEIVWRADSGGGTGSEGGLVHGLTRGGEETRTGRLEGPGDVVVMMPQQAVAGLGAGLVAGVGDVPAQPPGPVRALDGLTWFGGGGV